MPASTNIAPRAGYPTQLLAVSWHALAQLVRTPSHSRRAEAARKLARHSLWLSVAGAALVIALMLAFDQTEIQLMPARRECEGVRTSCASACQDTASNCAG